MLNRYKVIKEMLEDIDMKINHVEDMVADNRAVIVKLVKQSNQVVEFLKKIEIEEITDDLDRLELPKISKDDNKFKHISELVEEFMDKQKDLIELEKELKKYKDDITPGQVGEA